MTESYIVGIGCEGSTQPIVLQENGFYMKWLKHLLLITSILSAVVAFADDAAPPDLRTLYDQGKYQEVLDTIQKSGFQNAADYYNAANCYFRLGKLGQALSFYKKAQVLSPAADDIQYNLKLTEALLDKSGSAQRNASLWLGHFVPFALKLHEEWINLFFAAVTFGAALLLLRARKNAKKGLSSSFYTALCFWLLIAGFSAAVGLAHHERLGAIIADSGIARSGPNETFTELFRLPAGTTVQLTGESREGWQQIRFSLGNVGWIMEKDLLSL